MYRQRRSIDEHGNDTNLVLNVITGWLVHPNTLTRWPISFLLNFHKIVADQAPCRTPLGSSGIKRDRGFEYREINGSRTVQWSIRLRRRWRETWIGKGKGRPRKLENSSCRNHATGTHIIDPSFQFLIFPRPWEESMITNNVTLSSFTLRDLCVSCVGYDTCTEEEQWIFFVSYWKSFTSLSLQSLDENRFFPGIRCFVCA